MKSTLITRTVFSIILVGMLFCPGVFAYGGVSSSSLKRSKAVSIRNEGMMLQNKGDLAGAMKLFLAAQQEDPSYAEVCNDLGVIYESQGLNDQAEQQYLKAIELDPCFAGAYSNLALYYEGKREIQKARLYWKKRVEYGNPDDPWTQKAKDKLAELGDGPVSAVESPSEGKGLTPMQREARKYREEGLRLQQLGNIEGAFTCYMKAREIDPEFAAVYNDMGVIYETKWQLGVAEEHYLEAIRIDPSFASAYTNLAILSENRRDLAKAKEYWEKRRQLGVQDVWADRAEQRLRDIELVSAIGIPPTDEQDVLDLVKEVTDSRRPARKSEAKPKTDAQKRAAASFAKAQIALSQGDEMEAYKKALDAYQSDPLNPEIQQFLFRLQKSLLSK